MNSIRKCTLLGLFVVASMGLPACAMDSDDTDQYSDSLGAGTVKVDVCHIPPGNPANAHTITVGAPAVDAHLAHGDFLGPCEPPVVPDAGPEPLPDATPEPLPDAGPLPDTGLIG